MALFFHRIFNGVERNEFSSCLWVMSLYSYIEHPECPLIFNSCVSRLLIQFFQLLAIEFQTFLDSKIEWMLFNTSSWLFLWSIIASYISGRNSHTQTWKFYVSPTITSIKQMWASGSSWHDNKHNYLKGV